MKKVIVLLLAIVILVSAVGCDFSAPKTSTPTQNELLDNSINSTATQEQGQSDHTSSISEQALSNPKLLQPIGDSFAYIHPTFEWEPVNGATKYDFILATDSNLHDIVVRNRTDKTKLELPFDLNSGTRYYWSVQVLEPSLGIATLAKFGTVQNEPARFVVSNLRVIPRPDLGKYINIIMVDVENIGGTDGSCEILSSVGSQNMLPINVKLTASEKISIELSTATTTLNSLCRDYRFGNEEQKSWVIRANDQSIAYEFVENQISPPTTTTTPAPTPTSTPTPSPTPTTTPTTGASVPDAVMNIIRADALAKWGNDTSMVNYEIDKQVEAYLWIEQNATYPDILRAAKQEWGTDYSMVKYEYEGQLEDYLWINQQTAYPEIIQAAKQKWGTDYKMVKYEYEGQLEAYLWINQQTAYPEIMQAAKQKWGTDYKMVKYEYEKQISGN